MISKIKEVPATQHFFLNIQSKYMTMNFTRNYQFNTKLYLENYLLEQVHETRLLGLVINDKLSWQSSTSFVVNNAYKRIRIILTLGIHLSVLDKFS